MSSAMMTGTRPSSPCQVEGVDVAAVLEDDVLGAERGELDVILGEIGQLAGGLGGQVVDVEVHPLGIVAVETK